MRSISIALILVSIVAGGGGTVLGMMRAFRAAAASESIDPNQLANDINNSLLLGAVAAPGLGLAIVGLILANLNLRKIRRKEQRGW